MKLKEKTKKKIRGSITILLIILMLPSMTLSAIVVDSSRINMARSMVSSAGDLAMNTALANYDTILKDVYGLFAMSQDKTDEELAVELRDYFATTLVSYGVVNEAEAGNYVDALIGDFKDIIANSRNGSASNFLDMNVVDFTVTRVPNSSLADPAILRAQIVEYMKYRAPLNFGLSFLDSINAFKNVQDQTTVVQKQVEAQESVQDVTEACKKIIDSIREYDKLMTSINTESGTNAVQGKESQSDGKFVGVGEYHTQVDKYYSTWGENNNYSHINKLNLIFLLKAPSVDSAYLKSLDVNRSEHFIISNPNNPGLRYDASGIDMNLTLASSTSAAKTQVENQLYKLNNKENVEYKTATDYKEKDYLNTSYITSTGNDILNETEAIKTFVDFEKFLTDTGSLKYSNVKTTLESIYTLGKYYDNYYGKITAEVEAAKIAMDNANNAVSIASSNASTYYNRISGNVTNINNLNINNLTSYDFLRGILNSDDEDLHTVVSNLMAQTTFSMPTSTTYEGGKCFTNFVGYINNFKESSYDLNNQYIKVFKEIINSSLKSNATYKDICITASDYLSDKESGKTNKTFTNYIQTALGEETLENNLYVLLNHLYTNSGYVDNIKTDISLYDSVKNGYADLVADAQKKTQEHTRKEDEQKNMKSHYAACLASYDSFVREYQVDLQYYEKYISSAKAVIGRETSAVNGQFVKIRDDVKSLIDQLTVIETNLTNAETQISEYNKKLDAWSEANTTYQTNNGSDSFSKQNASDAQTSKNQYNIESLNTLKSYVVSIKKELGDFYGWITDGAHFKYGSKKIDAITTAEHVTSAVSSNVKDSLPTVVTVDDANAKLSILYNNDTTSSIEMEWYFLEPVLQIQFLKYLNETYPESASTTTPKVNIGGSEVEIGSGEGKFDYETVKSDLKNNSGKKVVDSTDENVFGYSYKGKSVKADEIPSKGVGTKTVKENEFSIKADAEDEDDLDVSSGFGAQNKALGTLLEGINQVAENTLENTYIMSYIFNNFSYNTLIQDAVMEAENSKVTGDTSLTLLDSAKDLYQGDTTEAGEQTALGRIKDNTTTLSNFKKNSNHNYFYGAEIEYLLYGNVSAEKNVTYTKASIYAIRFAFNCIYAFTNSEIRNSTMSVGLAVQAATLGIVPYQIVQIVLQLALAAGESAMDLEMMNNGLKVAVVKTNDTWALSISSAVKSAGEIVGDGVSNLATNAISKASAGLQNLVDAGTEELNGSIKELGNNLVDATEGKIEEVIDSAFSIIQSKIEEKLNDLQYEVYTTKDEAKAKVSAMFNGLEVEITEELNQNFGGNAIADKVLPHITSRIDGIIEDIKNDIIKNIEKAEEDKIGDELVAEMMKIRLNLINYSTEAIKGVTKEVTGLATTLTNDISGKLTDYIKQTEGEISEEVSKNIKEEVTQATNSFINKYLDDGITNAVGSGASGKASSSVSSMIKFGYKDYLMLFVFISLSVPNEDDPVVARIADMIQENITHLSKKDGANYEHKKGTKFKIKDAKTYVSVHVETQLDMLFLNMDFFTHLLDDDETEVSGQFTPAATIEYNGLFGY